jgi:hypothetical protein
MQICGFATPLLVWIGLKVLEIFYSVAMRQCWIVWVFETTRRRILVEALPQFTDPWLHMSSDEYHRSGPVYGNYFAGSN